MIFLSCLFCLICCIDYALGKRIPNNGVIGNETELFEKGIVNQEIDKLIRSNIHKTRGTLRSVLKELQGTNWEWVITILESLLSSQQRTRFQRRIDNSLQLASLNVVNHDNFHFPIRYLYTILMIDVLINYANNKGEPFMVLKEILDVLKAHQRHLSPEIQNFLKSINSLTTS